MNWGSQPSNPSSTKGNYDDFRQRQLFFQSCDKTIAQPKPLNNNQAFSNNINLKQVEWAGFGKITQKQKDRENFQITNHLTKRVDYTNSLGTEAKSALTYENALPFKRDNLPSKVNEMKPADYKKPHEYIARTITYRKFHIQKVSLKFILLLSIYVMIIIDIEMNKQKVHGVNWELGDDHSYKQKPLARGGY